MREHITLSEVGTPAVFDEGADEGVGGGDVTEQDEWFPGDMFTVDFTPKERIESGRQFAIRYLSPSFFFASSEKKRDRRFIPLSEFNREPPSLPSYPLSVKQTVDVFSEIDSPRP